MKLGKIASIAAFSTTLYLPAFANDDDLNNENLEQLSKSKLSNIYSEGVNYYNGENGQPIDKVKAKQLFTYCAKGGSAKCYRALGTLTIKDSTTESSRELAMDYFLMGAKLGERDAMYALAFYLDEEGEPEEAYHWLKECHKDTKYNLCTAMLGNMYLNGRGTSKDIEKGIDLLIQAKTAASYAHLGTYFFNSEDYQNAISNYEKAIELGNAPSYSNLSIIYGFKKEFFNIDKAIELRNKATELGYQDNRDLTGLYRASKELNGIPFSAHPLSMSDVVHRIRDRDILAGNIIRLNYDEDAYYITQQTQEGFLATADYAYRDDRLINIFIDSHKMLFEGDKVTAKTLGDYVKFVKLTTYKTVTGGTKQILVFRTL